MKVHFIAIGGAVMHNLAIALHKKGYQVTGSDDEIFEPSRSRLKQFGLLPENAGWYPDNITADLDVVILGMHARAGNPELDKALDLNIPVRSFPEFLYDQTKDKKRVVIGGSHGKTTITSMVMHVLQFHHEKFDYMVGSQIEGFETMVGLSDNTELAVFEGDEYLTSTLDKRPKFHLYKPHIALISGIAWDHMNVFPSYDDYLDQFKAFIQQIEVGGILIYNSVDKELVEIIKSSGRLLDYIPYNQHPHRIQGNITYLVDGKQEYQVAVFGRHTMENINGARLVCNTLGISDARFYEAIQSFSGAGKRMQLLFENSGTSVYLDFAHAPSKVSATTTALKEQYPDRRLVAVLELHTFSSLNAEFIPLYQNALDKTDVAMVYFNPLTIEHKKLPPLTPDQVQKAFGRSDLLVFDDANKLMRELKRSDWTHTNLLIMTSGNFDGQNLEQLALDITE